MNGVGALGMVQRASVLLLLLALLGCGRGAAPPFPPGATPTPALTGTPAQPPSDTPPQPPSALQSQPETPQLQLPAFSLPPIPGWATQPRTGFAISPDGKGWAVFFVTQGEGMAVWRPGDAPVPLTVIAQHNLAWTPTGLYYTALTANLDGASQIWRFRWQDKPEVVVDKSRLQGYPAALTWDPAGQRLIYGDQSGLHSASPDGSTITPLAGPWQKGSLDQGGPGTGGFAPGELRYVTIVDGVLLLCWAGRADGLKLLDLPNRLIDHVAWSEDGQTVAVQTFQRLGSDPLLILASVPRQGTPRVLRQVPGGRQPVLLGGRMYYLTGQAAGQPMSVRLHEGDPVAMGVPDVIAIAGDAAAQRLYLLRRPNSEVLYLDLPPAAAASTADPTVVVRSAPLTRLNAATEITRFPAAQGRIALSPNGRYLVYSRCDPCDERRWYTPVLLDRSTGQVVNATEAIQASGIPGAITWSDNGFWIDTLVHFGIDGKIERTAGLRAAIVPAGSKLVAAAVSPDGKTVAAAVLPSASQPDNTVHPDLVLAGMHGESLPGIRRPLRLPSTNAALASGLPGRRMPADSPFAPAPAHSST